MLAVRGLDKFSRNSKFLLDRIVPIMPILEETLGVTNHSTVGADTLVRFSSSAVLCLIIHS